MKELSTLPDSLRATLKESGVSAVYLFGSRSGGAVGPLSDYDFAVLLKSTVPVEKFLELRLALMSDFSKYVGDKNVDVIILNEAAPLLTMNVISDGRVLFEADNDARIAFETTATHRYLDRLPYERRHFHHLTNAL